MAWWRWWLQRQLHKPPSVCCVESNLFYTLAKWENNRLSVDLPENLNLQSPTMALIYDQNGKLIWSQRDVPGWKTVAQR